MRAGPVAAWAAILLAAASCKTYDREQAGPPAGFEAGTYDPAPGRTVYDDGGLVGGGGGAGGGSGTPRDGGTTPAQDVGSAAGADRAPVLPDTAPDLYEREAADLTCDLLMPTCGPAFGCYPVSAGRGRCQLPEPGTPTGAPCFEPVNCAPGNTCVDMTCVLLCSVAQATCAGGARCVAYAAYPGVGYCLP